MQTDGRSLDEGLSGRRRAASFVAAGVVVLASLAQFYIAVFLLPRCAGIFREIFGDHPLPAITSLALRSRWLLMGGACVWTVLALFLVGRRAATGYLYTILAVMVLQMAFIIVALVLPLSGTIVRSIPPST